MCILWTEHIKYWDREKKPFIYRIRSFQTFLDDKFTINFKWTNLRIQWKFRGQRIYKLKFRSFKFPHNNKDINSCLTFFFTKETAFLSYENCYKSFIEMFISLSVYAFLFIKCNFNWPWDVYFGFRHWLWVKFMWIALEKENVAHFISILFKQLVYCKANRFHIRCILLFFFVRILFSLPTKNNI